ncbi:MAG: tetratricopeptide repeat protein [Candidatus Eisenbacteria bacterium]|nr:tetratricopeptide repeat protein [Candidatus Eisenbacteria bacterium]
MRRFPRCGAAVAVTLVLLAAAVPAGGRRIAVLPAANASGPSYDVLAVGIERHLLRSLEVLAATRPELDVVPADSVRAAAPGCIEAVRTLLSADELLSSLVTVADDVALVRLELSAAGRGSPAGSEVVREAVSTIAVDPGVFLPAVGRVLGIEVTHADRQRLAGVETSGAALEAFLRGERLRTVAANSRHFHDAAEAYRRAVERDPDLVEAAAGVVEVRCRQYTFHSDERLLEFAETSIDSLLSVAPGDERVRRAHGVLLIASGRLKHGLDRLDDVLMTSPHDPVALRHAGRALRELGRREEAERMFTRLTELHPADWRGYAEFGVSRFNTQSLHEALLHFAQVVALNPEASRMWSNVAGVLHFMEEPARSIEAFERSLEIERSHHTLRNLSVMYFRSGDFDSAERVLLDALAGTPTDYRLWGALGTIRSHMGKTAESRKAYERAALEAEKLLECSPGDVLLMLDLAGYHGMLGKKAAAGALIESALELGGESFLTLKRIAQAYEVLEERDRALELIEEALRGGYPLSRIESSPGLRRLREDPRYGGMLDRLGLSVND